MDWSRRSEVKELMDNPDLDKESLREAYSDINRCNTWLGGISITIKAIRKLIKAHPKKTYSIFDMGCGDGYMLRNIAKAFKNDPVDLELIGFDLHEDVVSVAREATNENDTIRFKKADILALDANMHCDILICTLTMHHFKESDILRFIKKFSELAQIGIVINDLERSPIAYRLFKLFSFLFIQSNVAKTDGLTSISKGFKKTELLQIANHLNNLQHTITWQWAFRYLWVIKPNRII